MQDYLPFETTQSNHLRYWFGNDMDNHVRSSSLDIANMRLGGLAASPNGFVNGLRRTASVLMKRHPDDFVLFLSGGLDSEIALRCFHLAGYKFRVAIVKFDNDLNLEDVHLAVKSCQQMNIIPMMIPFDPLRFYESGQWQEVAVKYQCHTFYQQLLLSIAERLACPLLTVDEIELVKTENLSWAFTKKEDQDGCWHRFMRRTGIPGYNNFYTYDPATFLDFFGSPTVESLVNNQVPGKLSWTSSKHKIYQELTNWELQPRPKRHGMEQMMDIWYQIQNQTSLLLPGPPVDFVFEVGELRSALTDGRMTTCSIT